MYKLAYRFDWTSTVNSFRWTVVLKFILQELTNVVKMTELLADKFTELSRLAGRGS
jgi:hypothetical protein